MPKSTRGKHPDPGTPYLAAMAGSRESWRMVRAYIDQQYPAAIVAGTPEMMDAHHVPFPEGNGVRPRTRDLFRAFPRVVTAPQRIRPAD